MKYRDVEYSIVQGVERGKWMWSLSLDTNVKTSGQANNKPAAVIAANIEDFAEVISCIPIILFSPSGIFISIGICLIHILLIEGRHLHR